MSLSKSVEILKQGGVVIFPTETVYGLAADVFNEKAIQHIRDIKGSQKPFNAAVAGFEMVAQLTDNITPVAVDLIRKHWPGPLTLLFEKKDTIPDLLTAGTRLVGVRWPDNQKTHELIKKFGRPVVSTSANITGHKPPARSDQIDPAIMEAADDIIIDDKGASGLSSTVADVSENEVKILRAGPVKLK